MRMTSVGLTAFLAGRQTIDEGRPVRKNNYWQKRESWIKTTPNLDDLLISPAQHNRWHERLN